jgi:molybdopterin-guanine dinucleotide biosynthesis protein A
VVPRPDQEPEGVCALYVRELAPRIVALLEAGQRSLKSLLDRSLVHYVGSDELRAVDPQLRSFRNINTAADYEDWLRTQPVSR